MTTAEMIEAYKQALDDLREKEAAHINERLTFDRSYYWHLKHSDGKNADARKADAVLETTDIAAKREMRGLEADIARHWVSFLQSLARRSE